MTIHNLNQLTTENISFPNGVDPVGNRRGFRGIAEERNIFYQKPLNIFLL